MKILSPEEAAYLACAIDSEGHIGVSRSARSAGAVLCIVNTSESWLQSLKDNAGCGAMSHRRIRSSRWKPVYELRFRRDEIVGVLPQLLPWMRLKKKQAELLLRMCDLPKGSAEKWVISAELRKLNRRGTDAEKWAKNEYVDPTRLSRICPECRESYEPRRYDQVHCSMACYQRNYQRELQRQQGAKPRYADGFGYKARA